MPISLSKVENDASYDVVIVGAGMVGASAAIGLSRQGYRVLVLDAFSFAEELPDYTPSYDARSTALSYGTRVILEQLKVWQDVEKHAHPIAQVHVSEKGRFGTTRINAQDYKQDALGYVVPNQWLGRTLLSALYAENIHFVTGVEVAKVQTLGDGSGVQRLDMMTLDHALRKQVHCHLMLIADGTESKTAKLVGIEYDIEQYAQHALVANVSTSDKHNGVAYERFTPKGPLAMLPLEPGQCALVWTHEDANIERFMAMDEKAFCLALESAFGERLGVIEKCGKRASYPLRLVRAKEQCRSGVLLLGNAAHSLHPVAGQGFNLAIRGVASFLEYAKNRFAVKESLGDLKSLSELCAQRKLDQTKTIAMSDQLIKLFGTDLPLLNFSRELGLIGLDNITPLKSAFSAQAMGIADRKAIF